MDERGSLLRCKRETLCERLLELGEFEHEGTVTELDDPIVKIIEERRSLDMTDPKAPATPSASSAAERCYAFPKGPWTKLERLAFWMWMTLPTTFDCSKICRES